MSTLLARILQCPEMPCRLIDDGAIAGDVDGLEEILVGCGNRPRLVEHRPARAEEGPAEKRVVGPLG
ncbi:MAG TPA: hypothetical protein VJ882_02745, partial [Desulfuromonadales bacterium]|nr:hypothetical protein [Desulfuromonadales bacterium]